MPDVGDVHVDSSLTNVAIAFPTQSFIGPRLLVDVPVPKKSDKYFTYDSTRRAIATHNTLREAGAEAPLVDFDLTTTAYNCEGHALAALLTDEEVANQDEVLDLETDKVEFLTEALLVDQEVELASALSTAVTQTSDPTNEWDDYTNGDPIADMHLAINTVEDSIGRRPNVVAMDSKVWRSVRSHPDILQYSLYGGTNQTPAEISMGAFAGLFDLEEVIVSASLKNTAVQGQSASLSRIWGSDVYVAYSPRTASRYEPALGYRFVWEPFMGSASGFEVSTSREEKKKSELIQVQKYYDQIVTNATSAYRLQNRLT